MFAHMGDDIQIAVRTAAQSRFAFASHPHPGSGIDARRDVQRDGALDFAYTFAAAVLARFFREDTGTAAVRAFVHDREESLRNGNLSMTVTARTGFLRGSRFAAGSMTGFTSCQTGKLNLAV